MNQTQKRVLIFSPVLVLGGLLWGMRADDSTAFQLLLWESLVLLGYTAAWWDIRHQRVPNQLILAMLWVWLMLMLPQLLFRTEDAILALIRGALGFLTAGFVFLLVYVVSRKGLGGGDVKFMAAAGLYLGVYGVLPAMLYGCILSAVVGVILLMLKKIGRKDAIPLIPFLYVGMVITMLFQ